MAGASVKKDPVGVFSEQPDCGGGNSAIRMRWVNEVLIVTKYSKEEQERVLLPGWRNW